MDITIAPDPDGRKWVTIGDKEPTHTSLAIVVQSVLGLPAPPRTVGYLFVSSCNRVEHRSVIIKGRTFEFAPSLPLDSMTLPETTEYLKTELTRLVEWYNRTFPTTRTFTIPDVK